MAAPVKWLEEQKAIGDACIMLTDGICNWSTPKKFPMITIIANSKETKGPGWGDVVYVDP